MRDPVVAVRVLGPRPRDEPQREIRDQGAQAISAHRLFMRPPPSGTFSAQNPTAGPGGFAQHADWEQAAKRNLQARGQLTGWPGASLRTSPSGSRADRTPNSTGV